MKKAILFDWAGVVGADGYWVWLQEHMKNPEVDTPLFHDISVKADKGEISPAEFVRFIADHTGVVQEKVWPGIREKIVIDTEIVELIKHLRTKGYKVGLLSNFVYELLNEILTANDLYGIFDEMVISSAHGMAKPEPEIFQKMLDLLGMEKDEVIFIDDRQMHVDGARNFGIDALLFTNATKLKLGLAVNGINMD